MTGLDSNFVTLDAQVLEAETAWNSGLGLDTACALCRRVLTHCEAEVRRLEIKCRHGVWCVPSFSVTTNQQFTHRRKKNKEVRGSTSFLII